MESLGAGPGEGDDGGAVGGQEDDDLHKDAWLGHIRALTDEVRANRKLQYGLLAIAAIIVVELELDWSDAIFRPRAPLAGTAHRIAPVARAIAR